MPDFIDRTGKDDLVFDTADPAMIDSLIAALGSDDGLVRQEARQSLIAIGQPAVAPLLKALADPNDQVRWEAAKALGEIGDPAAASALVRALDDERFDVRWLAAEGLIALGREGLGPLLRTLMQRSDSVWLRKGARHVLHNLAGQDLKEVVTPVLAALEDIEPAIEVPQAALTALDALTRSRRHGGQRNRP